MLQLVYVSSSADLLTREELLALLERSRFKNERAGITGMLLYRDGNIMQVIEGEPGAVEALFDRISRDPRHRGLIVLLRREVDEREFPDWSMGFRDLQSPEVRALPGYSEFMNTQLGPEMETGRARRLLRLFRSRM